MVLTEQLTQFPYKPLYKPNQLICGTGQIGIVTGWTVRGAIAKHLSSDEFAVIGQLYSPTRGISFLIRNLLANPHVRFLVVLNATKEDINAGGCECLLDFFRQGFSEGKSDTGRKCWIIESRISGYIDIEIEANALEQLRQSVQCREAKSISDAVSIVKDYSQLREVKPWGKELKFPLAEIIPNVLPGTRYGHRIEGRTIAETWVKIIHRIKTTGTLRPTGYDGQWQELIDLMAIVTDEPPDFYFPEPNYLPLDREFIEEYVHQVVDDSAYRQGVKYTYGQRLRSWFGRDQIEQIIHKLIGEIDAASAVMSLWDVKDHDTGGSPCLNHIWLRVVDNELSMTATFRSNDMFSAWPANAIGLRKLQEHIRDEIAKKSEYNLRMGPLITISQSAHIYDDTFDSVDRTINDHYHHIIEEERKRYLDAVGNFLIKVEGKEMLVCQTTPGSGEVVMYYRGKDPLKLLREICASSPAIQPEHSGYLGLELQKAFDCIRSGKIYVQDQ
ncbi:thymidylate synthase [Kamptonema sp. UHCC 0994]|uniref:thymidylate synthase n=1 Tax=Kamptonema sp. UHCC 0994 TaxID=3031329 RepID=UPI0023B93B69|nr:thymidylate synthase [Kamptonema sp. UHCC 0994]MDF0553533.1 thymidylate synthase [Kamptonema sp. UHCC 0994]